MKAATKEHVSIRLFKSPILEALTHVHPSLPFIIWIPVIAYLAFQTFQMGAAALPTALCTLTGLLFWTLTEYCFHRFAFHYEASTKFGKYMVFLFHGIHHDDPQDPSRLVMPPVISITLGTGYFFLYQALLGPIYGRVFFCAFMAGYLVYDYIHFAVHHFRPRTDLGRKLKDNHMKHHFIAHGAKWGVSTSLWDHVFGTFT